MSEEQSPTGSELSFERAEFEGQAPPALACAFCHKPLTGQYWQIGKRPACEQCRGSIARELESSQSSKSFLRAFAYGGLAALAGCLGWIAIEKLFHVQIGFVAIGVYAAIALASLPDLLEGLRQQTNASASAASGPPSLGGFLWAWAMLLGIALASPFLQGSDNIIGLFIIGIGLYEAWKFTRPVSLQVLGPFSAAAQPTSPLAHGTHAAD